MNEILKPQDNAEVILGKISQFLDERGMKVSEKKTKLTATTDGFDFLGWNNRHRRPANTSDREWSLTNDE